MTEFLVDEMEISCYTAIKEKDIKCPYLKEHRPGLYTRLILSGMLDSHLADVDEQAAVRFDVVMDGYKRLYGISEQLKAEGQIRWVQMMNLARAEAEQSVLEEIVYS